MSPRSTAKRLQIIAQGFSPGNAFSTRPALKGRPRSVTSTSVPMAGQLRSGEPVPMAKAPKVGVTTRSGSAALSGRFRLPPNPGLKPWANLLCTSGAPSRINALLTSVTRAINNQPPITSSFSPKSQSLSSDGPHRSPQHQSLLDPPMGSESVSRRLPPTWDKERRALARQD